MKKILVTIPLIFLIVLSCIPCISATADSIIWNETNDGYSYDNYQTNNVPFEVDFSGNYFWFSSSPPNWADYQNFPGGCFLAFYYYLSLDNAEITENDGLFHFIWSNSPTPQFYMFTCFYTGSGKTLNDWSYSENTVNGCTDLYYDTSTGSVYTTTGNVTDFYTSQQNPPYSIKQQHLFLDGQVYDANALNVSVITNPTFSGSVNRSHTSGGIASTDDYFTLNVTNNGRTHIQWFFAIVESGYNVGYSAEFMSTPSGADITVHDLNIKYIYIARENCYMPVLYDNQTMKEQLPADDLFQFMADDDSHYEAVNGSVNSTWHCLNSGSSSGDLRIRYDMLDLQANHSYDVVAYAVKNYIGSTSYLWDNGEMSESPLFALNPFVNASAIEEVYRSSFSLVNPATYNPNSSIDGAIANNSGSDFISLTGTIYGYTDPLTGSHFDQYNYTGDGWGMVAGANNITYSGSANSSKFNTLMSESNGLLRFFSNCFGFFPRDFQMVAYSGFLTLIIICVWKRVH